MLRTRDFVPIEALGLVVGESRSSGETVVGVRSCWKGWGRILRGGRG